MLRDKRNEFFSLNQTRKIPPARVRGSEVTQASAPLASNRQGFYRFILAVALGTPSTGPSQ